MSEQEVDYTQLFEKLGHDFEVSLQELTDVASDGQGKPTSGSESEEEEKDVYALQAKIKLLYDKMQKMIKSFADGFRVSIESKEDIIEQQSKLLKTRDDKIAEIELETQMQVSKLEEELEKVVTQRDSVTTEFDKIKKEYSLIQSRYEEVFLQNLFVQRSLPASLYTDIMIEFDKMQLERTDSEFNDSKLEDLAAIKPTYSPQDTAHPDSSIQKHYQDKSSSICDIKSPPIQTSLNIPPQQVLVRAERTPRTLEKQRIFTTVQSIFHHVLVHVPFYRLISHAPTSRAKDQAVNGHSFFSQHSKKKRGTPLLNKQTSSLSQISDSSVTSARGFSQQSQALLQGMIYGLEFPSSIPFLSCVVSLCFVRFFRRWWLEKVRETLQHQLKTTADIHSGSIVFIPDSDELEECGNWIDELQTLQHQLKTTADIHSGSIVFIPDSDELEECGNWIDELRQNIDLEEIRQIEEWRRLRDQEIRRNQHKEMKEEAKRQKEEKKRLREERKLRHGTSASSLDYPPEQDEMNEELESSYSYSSFDQGEGGDECYTVSSTYAGDSEDEMKAGKDPSSLKTSQVPPSIPAFDLPEKEARHIIRSNYASRVIEKEMENMYTEKGLISFDLTMLTKGTSGSPKTKHELLLARKKQLQAERKLREMRGSQSLQQSITIANAYSSTTSLMSTDEFFACVTPLFPSEKACHQSYTRAATSWLLCVWRAILDRNGVVFEKLHRVRGTSNSFYAYNCMIITDKERDIAHAKLKPNTLFSAEPKDNLDEFATKNPEDISSGRTRSMQTIDEQIKTRHAEKLYSTTVAQPKHSYEFEENYDPCTDMTGIRDVPSPSGPNQYHLEPSMQYSPKSPTYPQQQVSSPLYQSKSSSHYLQSSTRGSKKSPEYSNSHMMSSPSKRVLGTPHEFSHISSLSKSLNISGSTAAPCRPRFVLCTGESAEFIRKRAIRGRKKGREVKFTLNFFEKDHIKELKSSSSSLKHRGKKQHDHSSSSLSYEGRKRGVGYGVGEDKQTEKELVSGWLVVNAGKGSGGVGFGEYLWRNGRKFGWCYDETKLKDAMDRRQRRILEAEICQLEDEKVIQDEIQESKYQFDRMVKESRA
ncbi:hypothetical protein ADUPG1_010372, partial [Aduncisulcus paluster]